MAKAPKIPDVSLDTWKDLYAAATKFAALEPWEDFADSEVFAVRDPETGQTGYACVLGALGEVYALCVYRGAEGFDVHRRMQKREFDLESGELIAVQNCLMAEFADRGELEKVDREVIKNLGLKFRGSNQWPRFRSHLPGFAPWHLDEAEVRFLTLALKCGRDAVAKVQDEDLDLADRPGQILCYAPKKGSPNGPFEAAWEPEPVYERPEAPPLIIDPEKLSMMRGKNLKSAGVWEADAPYFPGILSDRERPYFPRHSMVADRDSGMILNFRMSGPEKPAHQALAETLLESIEKTSSLPREVHVRGGDMARLMTPLAVGLGLKIEPQTHLEAVSGAAEGIEDFMAGRQPKREPEKRWDRRAMEKVTFNLSRRLREQEFESSEDANRYLNELQESGELDETPAPQSALEAAQNLMYEAFEHASPKLRVKLARRALKIAPDCADAYSLLAEETAGTQEEERQLYQQAMEVGERALGKEFFKEQAGHFWGQIESRPYMRARAELARCLWEQGDREAAIGHWREMLRLNPNDNQGMRHILLARLGELGRFDEMKDIFARYKDDCSLEFLLMKALAAFVLQGPSHEAATALREAVEQNKHFEEYLLGRKRLPRHMPDRLQMGGESEAVYAVSEVLPAWERAPGAVDWLADQLSKFALPKVGRNEPCPCGSGKKFKKCCGPVAA